MIEKDSKKRIKLFGEVYDWMTLYLTTKQENAPFDLVGEETYKSWLKYKFQVSKCKSDREINNQIIRKEISDVVNLTNTLCKLLKSENINYEKHQFLKVHSFADEKYWQTERFKMDIKPYTERNIYWYALIKKEAKDLNQTLDTSQVGMPVPKNSKAKPKEKVVKSFESLFDDEEDFKRHFEVLLKVKPALLDEKGRFLKGTKSKSKSAVIAYVDVLKKFSKLKDVSDINMARLLNKLIPDFCISPRSVRATPSKLYNEYFHKFDLLISKLTT